MHNVQYVQFIIDSIDPSPVESNIRNKLKSIGHGKVLQSHLYTKLENIEVVLLELVVEVCRRCRRHRLMGRVVSVSAMEKQGEQVTGFSRQMTLPHPSSLTHEIAAAAQRLLETHWSGLPIGRLSITLTDLTDDGIVQLTLFEDRATAYALERVTDKIKDRYGSAALLRASSLLDSGVAKERAGQIGGHHR